jgi:general stress protein 26
MPNDIPTEKKLDELYKLIDHQDIAMFTTRRRDGSLVSRPMATQERVDGTDLWFVTDISNAVVQEIRNDPFINLAYYNSKTREYVSVSGTASVSQDRAKIKQLYKPDWKVWFPKGDGDEDGGPNDPRFALLLVNAHLVEYLVSDKPRAVVLFEVVKALVTGSTPEMGDTRSLNDRELHSPAAKKAP